MTVHNDFVLHNAAQSSSLILQTIVIAKMLSNAYFTPPTRT